MQLSAPWTDDQVASLNAFQACEAWHPFTCSVDSSHVLEANKDGWECPVCHNHIKQNWCHGFMADWSWRKAENWGS